MCRYTKKLPLIIKYFSIKEINDPFQPPATHNHRTTHDLIQPHFDTAIHFYKRSHSNTHLQTCTQEPQPSSHHIQSHSHKLPHSHTLLHNHTATKPHSQTAQYLAVAMCMPNKSFFYSGVVNLFSITVVVDTSHVEISFGLPHFFSLRILYNVFRSYLPLNFSKIFSTLLCPH